MIKYLEAIGGESLLKGFLVFLLYGISISAYINFSYGLDSETSEAVNMTLEGPLSVYTFGWLNLASLILLPVLSNLGKVECNIESKRPVKIFWIALPVCEAAIALGFVIGATLLGIAIFTHFISMWNKVADEIYPVFYSFSIFFFFITYPVIYFTILTISAEKSVEIKLDCSAVVYIILGGMFSLLGLPAEEVSKLGIYCSILMLVFLVWKYFLRNHDK